jgi:hypothetical protein
MGWNTPDVYYNPEHFGLTIVGTLEDGGSYEFDTFLVLRDEQGNYYTAADAGCSCPSPFEDVTSLEACDGPLDRDGVLAAIDLWAGGRLDEDDRWGSLTEAEVASLKDTLADD